MYAHMTLLEGINYCRSAWRDSLQATRCKNWTSVPVRLKSEARLGFGMAMAKLKKNKTKLKLNITVREEQRNKLEQMAAIEKRSVSNLIEVIADERWERLVERQGVAYAKTVAEAMNLKVDMDNPSDREKLRRAVLVLVAQSKGRKQKRRD